MKKRLIAALMAIATGLGLSVPFAYAVTPADPLIASALYSFVLSAGIKLWRDGGIDGTEEFVDDMKSLWADFASDTNSDSWSVMGQGVSVGIGNFLLDHDAAQSYQSFANWLATKVSTPGTTSVVKSNGGTGVTGNLYTLPDTELSEMTTYGYGVWSVPISTGSDTLTYRNSTDEFRLYVTGFSSPVYMIPVLANQGQIGFIFVSLQSFNMIRDQRKLNAEEFASPTVYSSYQAVLNQVSRPNNGNQFRFYYSSMSVNTNYYSVSGDIPYNYVDSNSAIGHPSGMGYVVLAGDKVQGASVGDIFGRVGRTVLDLVSDLADEQGLAVSIGAGANAEEEDLTAAVVSDYAGMSDVSIPGAIAMPIPIEGVSELYPQPSSAVDVDSLGLPDLGKALTTRFPFCIPWDVVYLYQSLNATPQRPVIEIDLFPDSFKQKVGITSDTSFTFDLGDERFSLVLKVVRWSCLVGFVLSLAFATKRLIWTTGG